MLHEVGLILTGPGQCCMGCRRPVSYTHLVVYVQPLVYADDIVLIVKNNEEINTLFTVT